MQREAVTADAMGRRAAFVVDEAEAALRRAEEILRFAVAKMDQYHGLAEQTNDEVSHCHCETALHYRRRAVEQVERIAWIRRDLDARRRQERFRGPG